MFYFFLQNKGANIAMSALKEKYGTQYQGGSIARIICELRSSRSNIGVFSSLFILDPKWNETKGCMYVLNCVMCFRHYNVHHLI